MLDRAWVDIDQRFSLISGKEFIAELSTVLQKRKGFSVTPTMLIDAISREEIAADLVHVIAELNNFCAR